MADNLIFPIGFDLEAGLQKAQGEAKTVLDKLNRTINSTPLKLGVDFNADAAKGSIDQLNARIEQLKKKWNELSLSDRITDQQSGKFTKTAQGILNEFAELTAAAQSYSKTLAQIFKDADNKRKAQIKEAEAELKAYEAYWAKKEKAMIKEQEQLQKLQNARERASRQTERKSVQKDTMAYDKHWSNLEKQQSQEQADAQRRYNAEYLAELRKQKKERADAIKSEQKAYEEYWTKKEREAQQEQAQLQKKEAARERASNAMRKAAREEAIEAYKVAQALKAQEDTLSAINQKLSIYQRIIQTQKVGSSEWNTTALQIRRLTEELERATQQMRDFQQQSFSGLSGNLTKTKVQELTQYREQLRQLDAEFNKLNQTGKAFGSDGRLTADANNVLKQREAIEKRINQMLVTAADAQKKREQNINHIIEQRKAKLEAIAAKRKAEQQAIQANINRLKEERRVLNQQENSLNAINEKLRIQRERLSNAAFNSKEFEKASKEVERLVQKLEQAQAKLKGVSTNQTESINRATEAFKRQDGYVSRLVKRLAVYASFSAVGTFIRSVRDVTAQFELQRVSLGAIIQDQQRANQLFNEIKSFALKSPLSVLDLTKYTKQLAAYKIGVDDLFGTTKRLADISVGLGVSMDRIILMYGQIRASGYLRASEVRQATEAGIPLVEELAKKISKAKGELVSAGEVMDMISERKISFEMVKEVFEDMTSVGGAFYNMQITQGNTLFGLWSKLGDAASVMYNEIGMSSTVNSAIKWTIEALTTLMKNWKVTGSVLGGITTATLVYIATLKSAAIASNALTSATALNILAKKQQAIVTPRVVAAIIGENAAKKASIFLTKAHTSAVLKEATATNVLTKGFWKLTAAMLANPWVAVAAAVGGLAVALIGIANSAERAANQIKKLDESVSSLNQLDDTATQLIDTYDQLIAKTERTAEEEKKLSQVTHELAKRYPSAITAIGDFGQEIELATDKLKELYEAEKAARFESVRYELKQTEKEIENVEGKISKLQTFLALGKIWAGGQAGDMRPMTAEEKGEILKQIDALRFGEDGQGGLNALEQSANEARRALGLLPSEAAQAVAKFGAWKKTLSGFYKNLITEANANFSSFRNIRLFDDTTIGQFKSLEEALQKTAEEYKKNIKIVEAYDETLKSANLNAEERAKIETERAEANIFSTLAKDVLEYFNALSLIDDKKTPSDNRLQNLREIETTLTSINEKYNNLVKKEGETQALDYVVKNYASTLAYINKLGSKFGLKFEMPTDFKDLQEYRKNIQKVIETLKMQGYEKAAIELELKIAEGNQSELEKQLEEKLKRLADKVSRTKTAKEFYDKILAQTGNADLANRIAEGIYGTSGSDLFEAMVEQIQEAFQSGNADVTIGVDSAIDFKNQRINYAKLAEIYEQYQDVLSDKNKGTAKKIVEEGQKTTASNILNWQKELAKAQDYEEQRTEILRKAHEQRQEIIKQVEDPEERARLIALSYEKQAKALADLSVKEFKAGEDFIKVFQNLDMVSNATLSRMKKRLEEMIDTVKDAESVEGLKTLIEHLEKIDEEQKSRDPFGTFIGSIRKYIDARKKMREAEANEAKVKAEYAKQEPFLDADITSALNEQEFAQARVNELKAQGLAETDEGIKAQLDLEKATQNVVDAENAKVKAQKKVQKAEEKTTEAGDGAKKAQLDFNESTQAIADNFSAAASTISSIVDMLGIASDSELGEVFNGMVSALQTASSIMSLILTISTLISAKMWWVVAIGAAVAVLGGLLSWFTGSKVRKANKIIEQQKELVEQLEYSYNRLEKAVERAFGREYLSNYNQQLQSLYAQQMAYQRMAEAERSKGKKEDKEKTKEYLNNARDIADQIEEMKNDLASKIVGEDLTSAARGFAEAWVEAKLSFSNTKDAILKEFDEMVKEMVLNQVMGAVAQTALKPFFDELNDLASDSYLSSQDIVDAVGMIPGITQSMVQGFEVAAEQLRKAGFDIMSLGEKGEYSGIAKNISNATSEEINNAAAIGNSLLFHVSGISRIDENVGAIRRMMELGAGVEVTNTASGADATERQNKAMAHYAEIEANTAETVVQLRQLVTFMQRVMTTQNGVYGINTYVRK